MSGLISDAFGHDPSQTAAFAALPKISPEEAPKRKLRAVVIGGGTGAPVSIRTLLSMGIETSAVVAMADDGGSTGILRDQAGATAPGDIRKCLTAMAGEPDDPFTQAFKVRFGFAENHTLGNLMLSALEVTCGNFPAAIQVCEEMLAARGHVYPSTLDRVTLQALTRDGRTLEGQAVANHSRTALRKVQLFSDSEIVAYPPAMKAIRNADLIVLGPGSLYTSIIPNLIVPGITDAIRASKGIVVFVCSLADMQGETRGMTAIEHFNALEAHGASGLVDYMIAHDAFSNIEEDETRGVKRVPLSGADAEEIRRRGTKVIVTELAEHKHPTWHDPAALRHVFAEILNNETGNKKTCRSTRM